jgi:cytochrome b subunit of formate dehydrogenase
MEYKLTEDEVERIAARVTKNVLKDIGIGDAAAETDVRELRALLDSYRNIRKTIFNTITTVIVTAIVSGLVVWSGIFPKAN